MEKKEKPRGRKRKQGTDNETSTEAKDQRSDHSRVTRVTAMQHLNENQFEELILPYWKAALNDGMLQYASWGFENAPTTGSRHYHAFMAFKGRFRIPGQVKRIFFGDEKSSVHLTKVDGTVDEGQWYHGKSKGIFYSLGSKESTLVRVRNPATADQFRIMEKAASEGSDPVKAILHSEYAGNLLMRFTCYSKVSELLVTHKNERLPRTRVHTQVSLLYGLPGTGKSYSANRIVEFLESKNVPVLILGSGNCLEDGKLWALEDDLITKQGAPVVIIDEVASRMPICTMLQLLDRYPVTLPVKSKTNYGMRHVWVIICDQHHDNQWYRDKHGNDQLPVTRRAALSRRFYSRHEFTKREPFRFPLMQETAIHMKTFYGVTFPEELAYCQEEDGECSTEAEIVDGAYDDGQI